jgi:hypothetical protein
LIMDKSEEKMISEIEQMLVKRGLIGDKIIADTNVREQMKQRQETAYHNTQLFLENYRKFKWAVEQHFDGAIRDITNNVLGLSDIKISALIDALDKSGDKKMMQKFSSDIETGDKGRQLLEIFDKAMEALKKMPVDGETFYGIITMNYIQEEAQAEEIANKYNMSLRTYFRTKTKAVEQLSILMWNTPRGSLGSWAEVALILSGFHE